MLSCQTGPLHLEYHGCLEKAANNVSAEAKLDNWKFNNFQVVGEEGVSGLYILYSSLPVKRPHCLDTCAYNKVAHGKISHLVSLSLLQITVLNCSPTCQLTHTPQDGTGWGRQEDSLLLLLFRKFVHLMP